MKTLHLSLLLLLCGAGVCSCSKDSAEGSLGASNDGDLVEIRLNSKGLTAFGTKAGGSYTGRIVGWEGATAPSSYAFTSKKWETTATMAEPGNGNATISLGTLQYYNADAGINTYMKGCIPEGTLNNMTGVVTFTNTDGSTDILYSATAASGNKTTSTSTPPTLTFDHVCAQLKFTVQAGTGLASGTKVTEIKVNGVTLPTSLDIATGTVSGSNSSNVSVPQATDQEIPASATSFGNPLMVVPTADLTGISLTVTTNNATYSNVTIQGITDNKFVAGNSYTIALTFGQAGLSLNGAISAWTGQTGNVSLE